MGEGPEAGDILATLMRGAEDGIDEPGTVSEDHHREAPEAKVDLHLFEHPHRHERSQAVDARAKPGLAEACRDSDHALFRHADIHEHVRMMSSQGVEELVAVIAGQKEKTLVVFGSVDEERGEGVAHQRSSSSAAARVASSRRV